MSVQQVELAPGLSVAPIINGLWQVADMERSGEALDLQKTTAAMASYVEEGFSTFDMADHYGSSEVIAGNLNKNYPKPATFLTKWVPNPGPISRQDALLALNKALERLQTEQIELLQFHCWQYSDPAWLDALHYLDEFRKEGLVKHIGLTNFDSVHLNMVVESGIKVVSNQVCFSLLDQRAAGMMKDVCKKHNVNLLAFGTLAGGFLSEKWIGVKEPALSECNTWSQMKYKRFIDQAGGWAAYQNLLITLQQIASKHQVSVSNVATKYILDFEHVAAVIIGVRLGENQHMANNKNALNLNLDDRDRKQIEAVVSGFQAIPGDCGDEYRKPPFLTASGDLSHHFESAPSPYRVDTGPDLLKVKSGTIWEDIAGFSRAIKKGNRVLVSGTTATHGQQVIGGKDPAAQTHFIIDKIEGSLRSVGASLEDVVRTRIFIRNISDWEAVARAHGQRFNTIQPANTMVRADLIGDEYLVEIEAEAIIT